MDNWPDHEEILTRCQDWLRQTRSECDSLDEYAADEEGRDRLDELFRTQPWWRRLLCRPWHEAASGLYSAHAADTYRNIFDSLLEGYDLIENRLRRTMEQRSINTLILFLRLQRLIRNTS